MHSNHCSQLLGIGHAVIVGIQVGQVLEIVCIQFTRCSGRVGNGVFSEGLDFKIKAEGFEVINDLLQDDDVRAGGGADDNLLILGKRGNRRQG